VRVSFDTTLDDIHAFNTHYARTAALPQQSRKMVRGALTLTLASLMFALGVAFHLPVGFWVVNALILFGWWQFYPRRVEAMARRSTQKLYAEGRNAGMLGPTTVTIEAEWLSEASSEREVRTRWRSVERMVDSDGYIFLYVTGFSAVIVPARAFATADERAAFIALAQSRLDAKP
jgi:Na+/proline symporter